MDAQGSQTNAKEDTVYLALDGALATDLSQLGTNLTSETGGGYELNSARASLQERFEVYVRCEFTEGEIDVILVAHHNTALTTSTFVLGTDSSGHFRAIINAATVIWTGPPVPAGDVSIAWSMRPNPDATDRISEFTVYNHTTGDLTIEQVAHAAPDTASNYTLSVGGIWTGAALVSKPATAPTKVRISASFHPHVEFAEDWVEARASHSTSLATPREPIGVGLSAAGGVGEWAGQANAGFLGAHANALRGRMLSPLVNEVYSRARTITSTPSPTQWIANAPGSTFKMDVTKLRWLALPAIEWAFVRVHVTSWVTTGDPVPVAVRCYSMSKPHLGPDPGGALAATFTEARLTEDHGSGGVGEWLELGLLKLSPMVEPVPGWVGTTTLCLAYAFDPDGESTNDGNARLRINAWSVRPVLGEP